MVFTLAVWLCGSVAIIIPILILADLVSDALLPLVYVCTAAYFTAFYLFSSPNVRERWIEGDGRDAADTALGLESCIYASFPNPPQLTLHVFRFSVFP